MSGLEGLVTAAVSSLPLAQRANCSEVGTLLGSSHDSRVQFACPVSGSHETHKAIERAWQGA